MHSAARFMSFFFIGTGILYSSTQSYMLENLYEVTEKGDVIWARGMVRQAISPHTLPQLSSKDLKTILDADVFKGLPLTHHIISSITAENLNNLQPISIRHLLQKAEKPTAERIITILRKNPWMLLTINPKIIELFLMTASNGYANEIARLIRSDTLTQIDPSIIVELIKTNPNEVGSILIPLITYENYQRIDASIKKTLSKVRGYTTHVKLIKEKLGILEQKDDEELFQKELRAKRKNRNLLQS